MLGVGRDLCGSSSPTPLQRRRLHNLPGQPGPVLHQPQREEVLPHVQMELPMLHFVPIVTGHHWKESGPILLTPTLKIFISIYFPYLHVWFEIVLACTAKWTERTLMTFQTCMNHHVPFPVTFPLDNQTTDRTLERFSSFFFWGLAEGEEKERILYGHLLNTFPL